MIDEHDLSTSGSSKQFEALTMERGSGELLICTAQKTVISPTRRPRLIG